MILKFDRDSLLGDLADPVPVAATIGEPVATVQSRSLSAEGDTGVKAGVWRCTPGVWRRQVMQAEFCTFLDGECTFTPDGGEPIEIRAGAVLYLPENSAGVWNIRQTSTKIFALVGATRA